MEDGCIKIQIQLMIGQFIVKYVKYTKEKMDVIVKRETVKIDWMIDIFVISIEPSAVIKLV
jgi:hypothetical protein